MNNGIRNFTEDEIETITGGYSTLIGKGGFGEVYRGALDNDDLVAVKRYIRGDLIQEFMEEVRIHSQIDHKNIVKLIGYCRGENSLLMVTNYISNGNLEDILHNRKVAMPLDTRLGIAIGCAQAMCYMHSMHQSTDSLVCHGDIKPANILLDDNLTVKVSDFGLSRLLSGGMTRVTVDVQGSFDYMDPVYFQIGCLTPRSDVYSFGIVLLELISRKRVKEGNISLIDTFSKAFAKGRVSLREIFDAQIVSESNLNALEEIGKLAADCLTLDIHRRPKMQDVAKQLIIIWKGLRGQELGWLKKLGLDMIKLVINSQIYNNVRIFTKRELIEITQNYSYILHHGQHATVYKGSLEDNTLVAVKKYHNSTTNEWPKYTAAVSVVNEAKIISHIPHKNIIRLLGLWVGFNIPILVYEYASKGTLADILYSRRPFPLASRLKIAAKTAEALAYMHSSATGVVVHGCLTPYSILLDDNFMPKVSGFSMSRNLTLTNGSDIESTLPKEVKIQQYSDPQWTRFPTVDGDVYSFGVLLMDLIIRKPIILHDINFVSEFKGHYMRGNTPRALFDVEITTEDDIAILDEIGRLAVQCTDEEHAAKPTMAEVAELLKRYWKKCGQ